MLINGIRQTPGHVREKGIDNLEITLGGPPPSMQMQESKMIRISSHVDSDSQMSVLQLLYQTNQYEARYCTPVC